MIGRILNDAVLGFFALLSLFLTIAPSVFRFSDSETFVMLVVEYGIVLLFAIEYGAAWLSAADKRRYVLGGWRILDAAIIVAALVALLPIGPDVLRSSPVLRLLRLGRVALLGTRSSLALRTGAGDPELSPASPTGELEVLALARSGTRFEPIAWEASLRRIGSVEPDWLFISGVAEERLAVIATSLGVPEEAMQGLYRSSVPRFDRLERFWTLFVRYPLEPLPDGRLRRTPVLLVGTAENVVVLSREQNDLAHRVEQRLGSLDASTPRMVRAMVAMVTEILRAYSEVIGRLEVSLIRIESDQTLLDDERFLARTFELRADILRVRSSLKHLKSVIRDLAQGQLAIGTSQVEDRSSFALLADDASDLYEGIEDLRESLQALVDLRLNVSSFQMNRVMRLLALLTALALIPATAGGLLGMNLADTPWPATLAQVSFGLAAGMAMSLYVFAIKGWLR